MKKIEQLFPWVLSAVVLFSVFPACSLWDSSKESEVFLKFGGPLSNLEKLEKSNRAQPTSPADMECFVANVRGVGVTSTLDGMTFNDGVTPTCLQLGTVSNTFDLATAVSTGIRLQVKAGAVRTIEVLGIDTDGAQPCKGLTPAELTSMNVDIYSLGSVTTSLLSDASVVIANTYTPSTSSRMDDCTTPVSPGGSARVVKLDPLNNTYSDLGLNATAVHALYLDGNLLYVGGEFVDAGGNALADNLAVANLAGSPVTWSALAALNGPVRAITKIGSNIYVGGEFTDAGGNSMADGMAVWSSGSFLSVGGGIAGGVVKALADDGSSVYIGGNFTALGTNTDLGSVAKFSDSITAFFKVGTAGGGFGGGKDVRALYHNAGNTYVGGNFTNAGGNADADGLAVYTGTNLQAYNLVSQFDSVEAINYGGGGLIVGGQFNRGSGQVNIAHFDSGSWVGLGTGVSGKVSALSMVGTNVYVGGQFTDASGVSGTQNIAKYDFLGDQWHPIGTGLNGPVTAMATDGSLTLYIGGTFSVPSP